MMRIFSATLCTEDPYGRGVIAVWRKKSYVNGLTCLDFLVSALAALDIGTKKVLCDVQATARLVDEVAQDGEFLV